ncbi:MAG: hypothetical protein GWN54_12040 [Gammaproteobacteria bacterium]|nr:hypothetical protein [Gammaproteobacteria bacterium]
MAGATPAPEGQVQAGLSPGGPVVRIVHVGPYTTTGESYGLLEAYMAAHGVTQGALSWEHYISDPGVIPADELVTHIYYQVADPG